MKSSSARKPAAATSPAPSGQRLPPVLAELSRLGIAPTVANVRSLVTPETLSEDQSSEETEQMLASMFNKKGQLRPHLREQMSSQETAE